MGFHREHFRVQRTPPSGSTDKYMCVCVSVSNSQFALPLFPKSEMFTKPQGQCGGGGKQSLERAEGIGLSQIMQI